MKPKVRTTGSLITIEGLDGSGKATQAALLQEGLPGSRVASFPNYESDSSALVKMYLKGEFGTKPEDVNAYAASSFFAVDRYATYKKDWKTFYENGGTLICDRYTTSNAIHQCAKLPKEERDDYLNWLFHYEYELLELPRPDTTFYLHVDPKVSQELLAHRYQGDMAKKDLHEKDLDFMHASYEAARYCANKLGWIVIECCKDGNMRKKEEIHTEILHCLKIERK